MTSHDDFTANAHQGARLLDSAMPGWASKVDAERLDQQTTKNCVLGQVYGDYWHGLDGLGLEFGGQFKYGFSMPYSTADFEKWQVLTDAWRAEVRSRQAPTPVAGTRTRTVQRSTRARRVPVTGTAQVTQTYAPGQNVSVTKRNGVITGVTTWVTGVPQSTTRH